MKNNWIATKSDSVVKMNYISMLKKVYKYIMEIQEAQAKLKEIWQLSNNIDILLSYADELYSQCRFKECFEIMLKILELDTHNPA